MSKYRLFVLAGMLLGATASASISPVEAAQSSLQRTNAGSDLYRVTPAMMHAIDVIFAEKMKMMRHRR